LGCVQIADLLFCTIGFVLSADITGGNRPLSRQPLNNSLPERIFPEDLIRIQISKTNVKLIDLLGTIIQISNLIQDE
jgi:hypothetical protein